MTTCRRELICTEKALISETCAVSTLNLAMLSDCRYCNDRSNHFNLQLKSAGKRCLRGQCPDVATFRVFHKPPFHLAIHCDLEGLTVKAARYFAVCTLISLAQMPKLPFFGRWFLFQETGSSNHFIIYYQTVAYGKSFFTLLAKYLFQQITQV